MSDETDTAIHAEIERLTGEFLDDGCRHAALDSRPARDAVAARLRDNTAKRRRLREELARRDRGATRA